jgi:hypothetical protein
MGRLRKVFKAVFIVAFVCLVYYQILFNVYNPFLIMLTMATVGLTEYLSYYRK